jgi:Holliday junction DNA helicase RuvA
VVLELKAKAPGVMAAGVTLSAVAAPGADAPGARPRPAGRRPASPAPPTEGQVRAGFTADALSALVNLGYGAGDAAQAIATVSAEQPQGDTAALIRMALRLLAPR